MNHFAILVLVAALGLTSLASASVPIPADKGRVVSLDGTWRFKLEQAKSPPGFKGNGRPIPADYPATFEPFYKNDYSEGADWHDIKVPGNWEMQGFSPATYDNPDNASGFYRVSFEVPADWSGRLVMLNFDGVQNGCEIWCNGQPVKVDLPSWGRENYHESGYTAWQADLTPAVKFGAKNLLALRVTKNTKSVDADTGDYFFLGGVHRPVTLFSVPKAHVHDLTVRTKVLENANAELRVIVDTGDDRDVSASMQLEGQAPVEAKSGADGKIELVQTLDHPKLWSAEFPNLYTLNVELKSADGQVTEHMSKRIGVREISIEDGVFKINHVPVKLVGICRHDLYPSQGSAINADVWKKDLAGMKAANFNAVRTSHYPYGSGFYDLCDEMGFYVVDEQPFCWINCDKADEWPMFEQRVRETVARDKNHPCVVLWNVGNENKIGQNNVRAANLTEELDPSRPRNICSCLAGDKGAHTDFDDRHYVTVNRINMDENDPRRAKWPEIYTENPNVWDVRNGPDFGSLDLWWNVIDRTWQEIWKDDHIVGTFLWEWTDRAVADPHPEKRYYWYPETGINLLKTKGIVDAFRNPRPDYYHCKMAQTPIAVAGNADVSSDGVTLDVTNRYSFTDLNELSANWRLMKSGAEVAKGTAKLALAPRSHEKVRLPLPAEMLGAADTLRVDFDHPGGWNVVTYQFALKPVEVALPHVTALKELNFPRFNLLEGKVVKDDVGWKKLASHTGKLANIEIARAGGQTAKIDEAALLATALTDVRTLDADVMLDPAKPSVGRLHAEFDGSRLAYQVKWSGDKSDVYELGWEFRLPKGVDHFSWSRKAPWSYYPPDHIGRPTGTATPDSANDQLTHQSRADAFDFNSTKFDCDWASLTDTANRGLLVRFDDSQRQHVRGGVTDGGRCSLIINRKYSPPTDISSPVVPDLYTHLKSGDEVSGSFRVNPE